MKKAISSVSPVGLMKKDLIMHFRIAYKLVSVPARDPGTGKKVIQKILTPVLTRRGPGIASNGGVTISGMRLEHPLLGMIIKWGAALCQLEDRYIRKGGQMDKNEKHIINGSEIAYEYSLEHEFVTKLVSYENAKQIANVIAAAIWKNQDIKPTMEYLFHFTNEALPVEGTYSMANKTKAKATASGISSPRLMKKAA